MIEVEKKFALGPGDRERLTKGLKPSATVTMVDTYYDDPEYSLSTNDTWLRKRNGRFELKVPLHPRSLADRKGDQFQEIENDDRIREFLRIPKKGTMDEDVAEAGYAPFGTITTVREKYHRTGGLVIDLDSIDYGYELAEIELMVEKKSEMEDAIGRILAYAQRIGLTPRPVRGKVFEYIRRTNPLHYRALVDAGLVKT